MARLTLATPRRRTRRAERRRHGARVDMRRTLRASLRTGGDPIRLARRRRRVVRRRLVLLCDISGSMEPYARAYLQFLTCAAGGRGPPHPVNEAFVFATRLTRLTRALHSRNPERAIQRAAATAPDWSSGTRIGDALQDLQRPPRPARDGARRGGRDPLRRLGARRPGARRPRDGAAVAAGLPDRLGQPAGGRGGLRAAGRRHGGGAAALRRARQRPQPARRWRRWSTRSAPSAPTTGAGRAGGRRSRRAAEPRRSRGPSATPVPGSSVAMPAGLRARAGAGRPRGWAARD